MLIARMTEPSNVGFDGKDPLLRDQHLLDADREDDRVVKVTVSRSVGASRKGSNPFPRNSLVFPPSRSASGVFFRSKA